MQKRLKTVIAFLLLSAMMISSAAGCQRRPTPPDQPGGSATLSESGTDGSGRPTGPNTPGSSSGIGDDSSGPDGTDDSPVTTDISDVSNDETDAPGPDETDDVGTDDTDDTEDTDDNGVTIGSDEPDTSGNGSGTTSGNSGGTTSGNGNTGTNNPKPPVTDPPVTNPPKPPVTDPPVTNPPKPPVTDPPVTTPSKPPIETQPPKQPDPPKPPLTPTYNKVSAPGTAVKQAERAVIDYSNASSGYVMAKFTAQTTMKIKVQITGPATLYTYDLPVGKWVAFPLSEGNGTYKIGVYENVIDNKYANVVSVSISVTLKDQLTPFLYSNQYVDFEAAPNTINKAWELVGYETDPLKKVEKIYNFVVRNLTYDKQKAAQVSAGGMTGYLPVLDTVLAQKKGICFDYGALMAGMLRCTGTPCKLVVGYAGNAYHAWINVWSEKSGWINGVIYFNGSTWERMDPTFASSSNESPEILKYIGDGSNYRAKYYY